MLKTSLLEPKDHDSTLLASNARTETERYFFEGPRLSAHSTFKYQTLATYATHTEN